MIAPAAAVKANPIGSSGRMDMAISVMCVVVGLLDRSIMEEGSLRRKQNRLVQSPLGVRLPSAAPRAGKPIASPAGAATCPENRPGVRHGRIGAVAGLPPWLAALSPTARGGAAPP